MGAAEYLQRYKEQQAGTDSDPVEKTDATATGGAAAYLERYKAKKSGEAGQADKEPSIVPQPKDEPGFNVKVISEGLKKGISDVAASVGYLVDGANWIMDLIPGLDMDKDPKGGSKMIREGWQRLLMYEKQTPTSETEKYVGKVSEFLGGSLIMGPAMINRALGAQATWVEMKRAAMTEGVLSVAGGIGAQWQGDVFADAWGEEYRDLGEMSGGMTGPTFVLTIKAIAEKSGKPMGALIRALKVRGFDDVRAMVDDYGGAFARNKGKQKIAEAIGDSPSSTRNIDRSLELTDEIRDFMPSPSQASGSEGMRLMQQNVESKSVANINRAIKQELANEDAVYSYFREHFPEQSATEFTAKKIFQSTRNDMRMELKAIDVRASNLADSFGRQPTEKMGGRLVSIAKEKMKVVKKAKDAKYVELYAMADELGVVDDISDIRKLVVKVQADDQYFFDTVPGVYSKIKRLLNEAPVSETGRIELPSPTGVNPADNIASFRKIHSLYREVSREYGRALKNDDGIKMYHLKGIKSTLDDKLAGFSDPAYGDFQKRKDATDAFYRDEYLNVYKKGLGADILGIGRKESTPEGLIVSQKILRKGTSRGLDQFNKLYGDVPESQALIHNGILDAFAQDTVSMGKLSQKSIDTFLGNYKEVLDKLPATKRTFTSTQNLLTELTTRQRKLVAREKLFANQSASKYAKIAGIDNVGAAVAASLTDKGSMRILLRSMKTKEAKAGLASSVADHVMNQNDPWKFLSENEDVLKPVFNQLKPGHYRNLKNVAEAMNILNRHKTALRVNPSSKSVDTLQEMIGTSVPSAFAQVRWAALYGKTSMAYVGADIGSKYLYKLHQNNVERLIEEALYEPDLAKLLSDITTKEKVLPLNMASRLGQWAIQRGIASMPRTLRSAAIAEDQEQQPNTP